MRIEIDIPKEFEEHFKQDKFKDSFERIMADLKNCLCAGNYEYETIEMLKKAFEDSKSAYDIDNAVNELKQAIQNGTIKIEVGNSKLFELVNQGGVSSEDLCEYRRQLEGYNSLFITSCCHIYRVGNNFKFCPHCGKRIKVVE